MIKKSRPPILSLWDRIKVVGKVINMAVNPKTDYLMLVHKTHTDEIPTCKGNYAHGLKSSKLYLDYMAHMVAQAEDVEHLNKYVVYIGLSAIRQYNKRLGLPNDLLIMQKPIKHIDTVIIHTDPQEGLIPNEEPSS